MMAGSAPAGPVLARTPVVLAPPIPPWGSLRRLAGHGRCVMVLGGTLLAPRPFRCGRRGTRSPRHPLEQDTRTGSLSWNHIGSARHLARYSCTAITNVAWLQVRGETESGAWV